jgi:hypothetical protein
MEPAPSWLHVDWALNVLGFQDSPAGRAEFDEFVTETKLDDSALRDCDFVCSEGSAALLENRWQRLLESVAETTGVETADIVRSRTHRASAARRLVASIARNELRQSLTYIAKRLERGEPAICNLLRRETKGEPNSFATQRAAVFARYERDDFE